MKQAALGLALAGLLTACAHYESKPVALDRYPARLAASSLGPTPAGGLWSEADLVAFALAHNPQVAEAAAKYRTALAAARVARQAPAIGLTLTAEYSKEAGGSSPWLYGVGADFPLDVGARRSSRLTTADLTALQALYDYGEALWAVRTAVARARAELAAAQSEAPLADKAAAVRRDRFERLTRRVAAGEDARPTSLLAQSELFVAERRQMDAQARRGQAEVALAKAIGITPQAVRGLALAPVTAPDLAALQAWRGEAALGRRDVLRAVADYDLAEAALRLEIARQYPDVRLSPGYTWERGVTKLPFSLGLTLPPGDLNRAAIAQAEARRADAGASLEATQAAALAGVDQAAAALRAARAAEERVRTREIPLARRTADMTRNAVTAGELDRVDQLAAEGAAADAALAALDARRAADLATVDLEDALRRPFDPAETALLKTATAGTAP